MFDFKRNSHMAYVSLRTNALKNANKIFWSAFWVVLMIIIAQANATVNQLSVLIVCLFVCTEYLTEKNAFFNNLGCRTPAVLVLNSYSFDNKPMIIDFNGKIVRFIEFFRIMIKGTSMMTYNLSMGKKQWHIMVVELLLWVNFGILVVQIILARCVR